MSQNDPLSYPYLSAAPGRVNLLGEHVDYNDGSVLPAAIDRKVKLYFQPREDRLVTLHAIDLHQKASFHLDSIDKKMDVNGNTLPGWAKYPAGVAWALQQQGIHLNGFDATFTSNIPIGSGLSSSAAVEVAFAGAWNFLAGDPLDRLALVLAARQAENDYVGVNCGIMDQFASGFGVDQHALLINTRTLTWEALPLPPGCAIVIADSTIRRSLHTSAYNERRAACELAVRILSQKIPGIKALRDVTKEQYDQFVHLIPAPADRNARHVVEECERVDQAIPMLLAGDISGFGQLMFECHRSLRDLFDVSIPELDTLVSLAKNHPGCFGARLTGAGFGGCTANLVAEGAAADFMQTLKTGYHQATGLDANIYICKASEGLRVGANL